MNSGWMEVVKVVEVIRGKGLRERRKMRCQFFGLDPESVSRSLIWSVKLPTK